MDKLVCCQCGSNLLDHLSDGDYQCLYCHSIMRFSDNNDTPKVFSVKDHSTDSTDDYVDPELVELNLMELAEMKDRLQYEKDDEQRALIVKAIQANEEELRNMKIKD